MRKLPATEAALLARDLKNIWVWARANGVTESRLITAGREEAPWNGVRAGLTLEQQIVCSYVFSVLSGGETESTREDTYAKVAKASLMSHVIQEQPLLGKIS